MPRPPKGLNPAFRRPPKTGRPTTLNEQVIQNIARSLRLGNYLEVAAAVEGVAKETAFGWLRQGRKDRTAGKNDTLNARFSTAVEQAIAESELRDVARIDKAAEKDWRAAAWRLERKSRRRWQASEKLSLEGTQNGPPIRSALKIVQMDDSQYPPPTTAASTEEDEAAEEDGV